MERPHAMQRPAPHALASAATPTQRLGDECSCLRKKVEWSVHTPCKAFRPMIVANAGALRVVALLVIFPKSIAANETRYWAAHG